LHFPALVKGCYTVACISSSLLINPFVLFEVETFDARSDYVYGASIVMLLRKRKRPGVIGIHIELLWQARAWKTYSVS
jgi:hypothetical protein